MRRGHVEKPVAVIPAPAPPILHSPRVAPGVCPKCLRHVGRAVRAHAVSCGAAPVVVTVAPPVAAIAPQLAPRPLIGPQPDAKDLLPKESIAFSPRLPRLVHGATKPQKLGDIGNDRPSANPQPKTRRRQRDAPLDMRQAEAVRRMRRNAGVE